MEGLITADEVSDGEYDEDLEKAIRMSLEGADTDSEINQLREDETPKMEIVRRSVQNDEYLFQSKFYERLFSSPNGKNREFVLMVVKTKDFPPFALQFVDEKFRNDREIVLEAVSKNNGVSLEFASVELKNDEEIVLEAMKQNGHSFRSASKELQNDRDFVLQTVKKHPWSFPHASTELKSDKEIVLEAMKSEMTNVQFSLISSTLFDKLRCKYFGNFEKYYELDYKNDTLKDWEEEFLEELLKSGPKTMSQWKENQDTSNTTTTFVDERDEMEYFKKILSEARFSDLKLYRKLGRGAFASTYICSYQKNLFAIKLYELSTLFVSEEKRKELLDRDGLDIPYHENVVSILCNKRRETIDYSKLPDYETSSFKEYFDIQKEVDNNTKNYVVSNCGMIIMKYHRKNLVESSFYCSDDIVRLYKGIINGVFHLHQNLIVHRDIHSENIFVDDTIFNKPRVWIGDFGCALDLRKNDTGFKVEKTDEILFTLTNYIGKDRTLEKCESLAPEIVESLKNEGTKFVDYEKSDLYSVGKVFEESSMNVFLGMEELAKLKDNLIMGLIKKDPGERMDFLEASRNVSYICQLSSERKENSLKKQWNKQMLGMSNSSEGVPFM